MKKCNLVFSKHAQIRCSQRSIDLETCQLLQSYGISSCHDNRGGLIIKFNKDSFELFQKWEKKTRIRMEKEKCRLSRTGYRYRNHHNDMQII